VREQNLDANGNIKVHEQGTANVNVTISSLSVAPAAPITDGGAAVGGTCVASTVFDEATASALSIHMDSTVNFVKLDLGDSVAAEFDGPGFGGNASIVLALTRPIKFNKTVCAGTGGYSVSWMGNKP
jgi:hypothetical protein